MRAVVLVFLTAVGLALGAGPATAGGPTSVLLTWPAQSRATALYNGDPGYTELQSLLDAGTVVTGTSDYDTDYVNVTWLVHDVHIWRTDRVFLDEDGPAVETTLVMGGEEEAAPVRRKLDKPERLTALLSGLGLAEAAGPAGTAEPAAPAEPTGAAETAEAAAPVENAVAQAAQRTSAPAGTGDDARWEWGIGGVLLGALAAGLVFRARSVRAAR